MYKPINIKKEVLIFIALFFAVALISFWILNGGAYFNEITYALFGADISEDPIPVEGSIIELKPSPVASASVRNAAPNTSSIADNAISGLVLTIPKIGVIAPIVSPTKDTMPEILATLEKGVGLYPGSNLPGQGGRGVILGHSSRASWYRGNYAYIFSLLSKVTEGDEFYIAEGHTRYVYRVFSKKYLTPADTNALLAGPSRASEIDLITCYPVGSASKRTVIQAELVRTETF